MPTRTRHCKRARLTPEIAGEHHWTLSLGRFLQPLEPGDLPVLTTPQQNLRELGRCEAEKVIAN